MSAKTIIIDDISLEICIDTKSVMCDNEYEFNKIIHILLTPKQQENFIVEYTNRRFSKSKKN